MPLQDKSKNVAPFAGAWIEMQSLRHIRALKRSLPSRERGLKCSGGGTAWMAGTSLPSRERGLKFLPLRGSADSPEVAPFAGAWIEIAQTALRASAICVAPFAGAWIEMPIIMVSFADRTSLPSRERGLKWIAYPRFRAILVRRSLRGSVD